MRHLFSGDRSSYIDDRIKEVEGLMANVPEVPDGWSSEKLQQAREKEEKVKREAKEEAERKELEASWKKWWQVSLYSWIIITRQKSYFLKGTYARSHQDIGADTPDCCKNRGKES